MPWPRAGAGKVKSGFTYSRRRCEILSLAGRPALSPFRLAKLLAGLSDSQPGHGIARSPRRTGISSSSRARSTPDERATLERAADLRSRAARRCARRRHAVRSSCRAPAPISPWSSKATDIARNCGLDRGRAHRARRRLSRAQRGRRAAAAGRSRGAAAAHPRPHDRGGASTISPTRTRLFAHVRAAAARDDRRCTRTAAPRSSAPTSSWVSRSRPTRSTTSRELPAARPQSDRRRAHDVRAGELRALPAQDLQRRLDHRRRAAGQEPLRHDPQHAPRASRAARSSRIPTTPR